MQRWLGLRRTLAFNEVMSRCASVWFAPFLSFALTVTMGATAHAQHVAIALDVLQPSDAEGCFDADALKQRIAHYGGTRLERAGELRLELVVETADTAELRVYRRSELVARRRFERLPVACVDRRNAVALSIALALEGVVRQLAAAETADSTPAENEPMAGARDAVPPSAASRPGTAEARESAERVDERVATSTRRQATSRAISVSEPARAQARGAARAQPSAAAPSSANAHAESEPQSTTLSTLAVNDPLVVQVHLGGRWLANAAPTPVWAGALGAELWVTRSLAFDAAALASTLGEASVAGGRVLSRLIGGELLGCGTTELGKFGAQACLGVVAAACQASGRDFPVSYPASSLLWAASTVRFALRWPTEQRVSLRMVVQGHINLVRPEPSIEDSSEQLHLSVLGASAGIDLSVSLH